MNEEKTPAQKSIDKVYAIETQLNELKEYLRKFNNRVEEIGFKIGTTASRYDYLPIPTDLFPMNERDFVFIHRQKVEARIKQLEAEINQMFK